MDTYYFKFDTQRVNVGKYININFNEPVAYNGNLHEVFPNLNITNLPINEYYVQLYYSLVKGMSRRITNKKKVKKDKDSYTANYLLGINCKKIFVSKGLIAKKELNEYPILNNLFAAVIAQILYENIEEKPYELKITGQNELMLKKVKFYLTKAYFSPWFFIRDYINCDVAKIETRLYDRFGFNNLKELENQIKRTTT